MSFFFSTNHRALQKPCLLNRRSKSPPKSINAALSEVIFFYTLPCSRSPISLPLHAHADISSNPLIRPNEGLALETSAFKYFYGSKFDLRSWGHLSINKFIGQSLHLLKRLYLGFVRSNLDMILQRHCEMTEV